MHSFRSIFSLSSALLLAVVSVARAQNNYVQTDLVCDPTYYQSQGFTPQNEPNIIQDSTLIDAWGISIRPAGAGGHFWLANAMTGTSAEYLGDVNGVPLHQDGLTSVPLDTPKFTDHGYAFVTGVVYNSASDVAGQPEEFPVSGPARNANTGASLGTVSGASKFVFVTQDGCINAWLSNTATAMYTSPVIIDYSKTAPSLPYAANCVFTGAAMTQNASTTSAYLHNGVGESGNLLFAADQRNNAIEVFDNTWKDVTTSFKGFQTPTDVAGLHVFNIQDINQHLYVTYAEFNPAGDEGQEQIAGAGLGHLVEYNEDGTLAKDFNDGANTPTGVLNEPWGVAIAPGTFGAFGGDVLVANFGDGTIAAFDPTSGNFVGYLHDPNGNKISVDGIWGLTFGNGVSLGDANSLYFSAGPNSEYSGLFGKLTVETFPTDTPAMPVWALAACGLVLVIAAGRGLRQT
jgi:uncharacterized protein (TIGR03118 family)